MGYIVNDIADITEPKRVTLAALPNFLQLASKASTGVNFDAAITPTSPTSITVTVQDAAGGIRVFTGTNDPDETGGYVFHIATDPITTAENLRAAMLSDLWLAANFDIAVPLTWSGGVPSGGAVQITSKGQGVDFNLTVTVAGATYTVNSWSSSTDTIKGGAAFVDIVVDLFASPAQGILDADQPVGDLGTLMATLSKTYTGTPIWFDLNGAFSGHGAFNAPPVDTNTWADTGTWSVVRAYVKRKGVDTTPIYISRTLFVIDGFGRLSGPDLSEFVYRDTFVKLLTNKPNGTYMRGQIEYLNVIIDRGAAGYALRVARKLYRENGEYITTSSTSTLNSAQSSVVNTTRLGLDAVLDAYPDTARIDVVLTRNGATVSNALSFRVVPDCLHELQQFSFINRLGGWDSVNFDAGAAEDIRGDADTFRKTVTPSYSPSQGPEGVYRSRVAETTTIQGAPVSPEVAEWLKEFAAARVILDAQGRRVILEDFTLRKTSDEMSVPTIKYRLSETYTNED